jgi:NAD(P)-dependent dehydrogenase (short-subunit alcohol dehydrogenase family)
VLVVGGTGLIGHAVVERLRTEGATAVAASRHVVGGITLDAQDSASVTAALEQVIEQHGRLDALVVAAAPSAQTLDASRHADPDQVLRAVDAKAMSFLRLTNAALPIMARAGYTETRPACPYIGLRRRGSSAQAAARVRSIAWPVIECPDTDDPVRTTRS